MNQEPTFTVIIPHKNTHDLLKRCLNSIPRREDVQIIVVDDNSNPDTVDFDHFPGLDDPFVEVVLTKEGKGAGYARNIGLARAKGKWLLFADADDYFVENAFDIFFSHSDTLDDILFYRPTSVDSDTGEPTLRADMYGLRIDRFINNIKNSEDHLRYHWAAPWAKMIRKTLVDRECILFEESFVCNDVMFSCLTGHYARSINCVDVVVYVVTASKGSLSTIRQQEDVLIMRFDIILRRNKFLREINKRHCTISLLMPLIFNMIKLRFKYLLKIVRLHFVYKDNPFANINLFAEIKSCINYYFRQRKKRLNYYTKSYKT